MSSLLNNNINSHLSQHSPSCTQVTKARLLTIHTQFCIGLQEKISLPLSLSCMYAEPLTTELRALLMSCSMAEDKALSTLSLVAGDAGGRIRGVVRSGPHWAVAASNMQWLAHSFNGYSGGPPPQERPLHIYCIYLECRMNYGTSTYSISTHSSYSAILLPWREYAKWKRLISWTFQVTAWQTLTATVLKSTGDENEHQASEQVQ